MQVFDLPAYKVLRDAMLAAHEEAFTSDAATELKRAAASYQARMGGQGGVLFTLLAWQGERLLGAISAERDARAKVAHIAHVVGMMVSGPAQGQGVGRALLQAALDTLRANTRLRLVTLSVTSSNTAALRLYQSAGFTRYGQLQAAIQLPDGSTLDKDLMFLRL